MDPAKKQQAPSLNIDEALSKEFDRMLAGDEPEIIADSDVDPEVDAAVEEAAEEEGQEGRAEEEPEAQQAEEPEKPDEVEYDEPAPDRWPADLKEAYNSLPPAQRQLLMDRIYKPMQRSYTQSTTELAEMRKTLMPMLETMKAYQGDFDRSGLNPVEVFRNQLAWAAHFQRVGPEKGLADMKAAYGLDARQPGQTEEEYLTPVERGFKQQLEAQQQMLNQFLQNNQQQQQTQQQQAWEARVQDVRNGLQSFINEQKDGKPAHPHVERVAPAIAGIIRGGLVKQVDDYGQPVPVRDQLAQAYKMACDLDPSLRAPTTSERQVGRAKAARDVAVVANNPATQVDVPEMSIDEMLSAQYDKMLRRTG